jgi:hypothetical protein
MVIDADASFEYTNPWLYFSIYRGCALIVFEAVKYLMVLKIIGKDI